MASVDPYYEEGSSDEEEEDWQDQEPREASGEGGTFTWTKDHQVKNSQVTELVNVSDFKALCSQTVPSVSNGTFGLERTSVSNQDIANEIGISLEELQKVQEECNPAHLLPTGGFIELQKLDVARVAMETSFRSFKDFKQLRYIFHKLPLTYGYDLKWRASREDTETQKTVQPGEILLSVAVFHPITKSRDREYMVLGSQLLTELRDRILCYCDYTITKDLSDNPSSCEEYIKNLTMPPTPSTSAFFFINNTFYNDWRHPDSKDLSESIIEWSSVKERQEQSRRLEQFTKGDMAQTTFDQLTLRLGYPYLYFHHRDCQHLIKFTDMRVHHPTVDSQLVAEYPLLTHRHRRKAIKCKMCKSTDPKWATFNDELAPCSPCHFCDDCFTKLHYTTDGKKLAKFEAYPFHPASH